MRSARFLVAALLVMGSATAVRAQQPGVRLGLIYGENGRRPGILVMPVPGPAGDSVRAILMRDLDFGDRVTVLPASATIGTTTGGALNYPLAARLGAQGIVQATVTGAGLQVVLHDVAQKKAVQRTTAVLPGGSGSPTWRAAVHQSADAVEEWITGVRGIAATRIAYVGSDGRIWLVDSDGANASPVTPAGLRALSPSFNGSGSALAFAALEPGGSSIRVADLRGGTRVVVPPQGLNVTPAFRRDGQAIAYAHGDDFGTELLQVPASGGAPLRITVGRGTDNTSPTYSPDGRRVAFTSGRSGHPEVYIADADGTNADVLAALSSGDQAYRSSPDWSPDGRAVAFQARVGGRFQAMVITLRDRAVKQVTADGSNEDPAWAPDARHLVVSSTRSGARQLFVVDLETGRARQLTRQAGARLPAWSPRLGN